MAQGVDSVAPVVSTYEPAGAGVQGVSPVAEKYPMGHGVGAGGGVGGGTHAGTISTAAIAAMARTWNFRMTPPQGHPTEA